MHRQPAHQQGAALPSMSPDHNDLGIAGELTMHSRLHQLPELQRSCSKPKLSCSKYVWKWPFKSDWEHAVCC